MGAPGRNHHPPRRRHRGAAGGGRRAEVSAGHPFPGLLVGWGLTNGQFTPASLARKAAEFRHKWAPDGIKWLALQEDFVNDSNGIRNADLIVPFVREARARGIAAGVWQTNPRVQLWSGLDFYMAELERPIDTAAFAQLHRSWNPRIPSSFISNLDTHGNPDYFKPLVAAGFTAFTEAYLSDNPQATPERMDFTARQVGIPVSYPGPSLYAGRNGHPTLDSYDLSRWPGWAGYLAEHLL